MKAAKPLTLPLSPADYARLRYCVRKLIQASIEDATKGGGDPEDAPFIEHDLRSARASFWSLFVKEIK